ncbi:hypothetical protein GDO81_006177 [Engystomops pustulosus]|uniref:Uncharacterized protein n=1 Tax=Engystomops pustulosus TaxID=76066 RepID=A0AAV7CY44_ENGPU|nr:hypothetical protein GDO81_006177 [Engystomops pustulosus]
MDRKQQGQYAWMPLRLPKLGIELTVRCQASFRLSKPLSLGSSPPKMGLGARSVYFKKIIIFKAGGVI